MDALLEGGGDNRGDDDEERAQVHMDGIFLVLVKGSAKYTEVHNWTVSNGYPPNLLHRLTDLIQILRYNCTPICT